MNTLRKYPPLLRAYFARSIEYRGVILIWVLAGALPLIILAVWLRLAQDGPIGNYGSGDFVAYYLAVMLTRQITGAWVIWDLDYAIRQGDLSARLLRPLHPIHYDVARVLAQKPLSVGVIAIPVAVAALLYPGRQFDLSPLAVVSYSLAVSLALLIALFEQWCLGCLAFWWSHVTSLHDMWYFLYSFLGGQLVPLTLLPAWLYALTFWLPFRYLMSFPVEILTGHIAPRDIAIGFGMQLAWLFIFYAAFRVIWRLGLREYSAVGA